MADSPHGQPPESANLNRLCALPPELIGLIGKHLHRTDILHLRRACRRMHLDTLSIFSRRFFSVFTTDLSKSSMERLERIAANDQLRTVVRTFRVCAAHEMHCTSSIDLPRIGHGLDWTMKAGDCLDLSNCQPVLFIIRTLRERLVNCRQLDLSPCVARGSLRHVGTGSLSNMNSLHVLLSLISSAIAPKSFRFAPGHSGLLSWFFPAAVPLSSIFRQPDFEVAWGKSLQNLYLTWDDDGGQNHDGDGSAIIDLVMAAQNLAILCLEGSIPSWSLAKLSTSTCNLSNLASLTLVISYDDLLEDRSAISADVLTTILKKLTSKLRSITLSNITLQGEPNCWSSVLRALASPLLSGLRYVALDELRVLCPIARYRPVFFDHDFEIQGQFEKAGIRTFPAWTRAPWRQRVIPSMLYSCCDGSRTCDNADCVGKIQLAMSMLADASYTLPRREAYLERRGRGIWATASIEDEWYRITGLN